MGHYKHWTEYVCFIKISGPVIVPHPIFLHVYFLWLQWVHWGVWKILIRGTATALPLNSLRHLKKIKDAKKVTLLGGLWMKFRFGMMVKRHILIIQVYWKCHHCWITCTNSTAVTSFPEGFSICIYIIEGACISISTISLTAIYYSLYINPECSCI